MASTPEARRRTGAVVIPSAATIEDASTRIARAKDRLAAAVVQRADASRLTAVLADARYLRPMAEALARDVEGCLSPAPESMLEDELRNLLLAYPNPPREVDLAGYAALLSADVREARPSRFAIHAGCTRLRRTSRYFPAIAEVLAAIAAAEQLGRRADEAARGLPRWIERAERLLEPVAA